MTEPRWELAATVADWVRRHQLLVYVVLGAIAWAIAFREYPLESLIPVYANF
jgi:hypothetical protein